MTHPPAAKTGAGRFFEDFSIGQALRHATPRTLSHGDVALYSALFGSRFAVQSADTFAQAIGYPRSPVDDLLAFHIVFGKTVADISLNAIANLGYADCRFLSPVYPGDTLSAASEVIGLKENSNRESGVVYVRSRGFNQHGSVVLDYVRWVMVRKFPICQKPFRSAASGRPGPLSTFPATTWRSPDRRIAGAIILQAKKSTMSTA
jgi:2-methylfumaryl-CoA hydratase